MNRIQQSAPLRLILDAKPVEVAGSASKVGVKARGVLMEMQKGPRHRINPPRSIIEHPPAFLGQGGDGAYRRQEGLQLVEG